jgi:molecular chaperone DnaK (HSP70)
MLLAKMKKTAEAFLGQNVHDAVIGAPANLTNRQIEAIKDAGAIAGLNVFGIFRSTYAAAITYIFGKREYGNYVIFDFGAGSLTVSILKIEFDYADKKMNYEKLEYASKNRLGGNDLDNRMVQYYMSIYLSYFGIPRSITSWMNSSVCIIKI